MFCDGDQSDGVMTLALSSRAHASFASIQYGWRARHTRHILINMFNSRKNIFMI